MWKRGMFQISLLILLYFVCRLLFVVFNSSEIEVNSANKIINIFFSGLRFDLSAIGFTNGLFFLLAFIPLPFRDHRIYIKGITILFLLLNGICLFFNLIDVAYFSFIHKRSQIDLLRFFSGSKGTDMFRLIPTFILDFWYLFIFYALLFYFLYKAYLHSLSIKTSPLRSVSDYLYAGIVFLFVGGLSILAIRGGTQEKPLDFIHASEMTNIRNIPAVLNTPFSMIKSYDKKGITEVLYFEEEIRKKFENGIRKGDTTAAFSKQNVVIIIIESLSKKYPGFFGGKAETPFLDSLFSKSLVFTNAFANGKESVQGIPAVVSSIPSWQTDPFIFSPYASNKITSLANVLKEEGYKTSFYHGGFNGTMGFDSYAGLAGFDHYYGRNEYNNDDDYDGDWGIWDEPFLQYMARQLSAEKQPFFSTVFTLNTHHPFIIPSKYKKRFNKSKEPMLNCIAYLDYSLSRFFETIKTMPWYSNTLFVITADHTAPNTSGEFSTSMDEYRIPIVFFNPRDETLKGKNEVVANQIDILPSVLDRLHYPHAFFSMGKSLFTRGEKRFSISFNNGIYQYIDSAYCYQFNGQAGVGLFQWKKDSLLQNNIIKTIPESKVKSADTTLKMMIQFFNQSMIHNRMSVENIR